jgi:hypothetical protein
MNTIASGRSQAEATVADRRRTATTTSSSPASRIERRKAVQGVDLADRGVDERRVVVLTAGLVFL